MSAAEDYAKSLASVAAFAEAEAANAERAKLEALARFERERAAGRAHRPMNAGGLFDEVRRQTQELDL